MEFDVRSIQEAGFNPERVRSAVKVLVGLREVDPEARENRIAFLRALAELARENNIARICIERLLQRVERRLPDEAVTFRACYLEEGGRKTAKEVGRRLFIDYRTVYSHNRRVLMAMLPAAFGVDGVFSLMADIPTGKTTTGPRSTDTGLT